MDRFLNIDWNLPLEDIIDTTFISEERLEKESVMHRIMTGNFTDPFKNIEEDIKDVKIDLMEDIDTNIDEEDNENDLGIIETKKRSYQIKKTKSYVPGIVKPIFKFPKKSQLNKEQQAMCLKVLLRFSESDKPKLTQIERDELQNYMDLQQIITQEQDQFLDFAKSKWQERSFKITCEDYINLRWTSKLQYINKLPRYYTEVTNIPFVTDKSVEAKFISTCLQLGELPNIVLPKLTKPYMLHINSEQLQNRFPPKNNVSNESLPCFKFPVSEDVNCQKLAESNNVDLVISSSGLNCLLNNLGPSYSNSWILPVVIKTQNDKNVIYIDSPAPPTASTVPEKNTWVYKYILKYFLIDRRNIVPGNAEGYNNNIFGDVNSEELLKLEEQHENDLNISSKLVSNVCEQDKNVDKVLKPDLNSSEQLESCTESSQITPCNNTHDTANGKDVENKKSQCNNDSISYSLFAIGPQSSEKNELMKNVSKEYKILVRTKTDGFELLENKIRRLLLITPKLEHQVDLGAEAVTLEEAVKQWVSLIFRPHTTLIRVRINAITSEVLQLEHRTTISINNEIKRLYNIRIEDSLVILHNVIQSLSNVSCGRYIIRHTIRNGAFATLFKVAESPGKNTFDMHTIYDTEFHTLPSSPWMLIDKTIPTPMFKCFERMPAMFFPSYDKTFTINRKNKRSKAKLSNTGTVRRSLRNKKQKNN